MKKESILKNLAILLFIYILIVVTFKLFFIEPKSEITIEILLALGLLVILVLSESFNSFSIGSIISLEREVKEKSERLTQISNENNQLRNHLISMYNISSKNQTQSHSIVNNYMHPTRANNEEIEQERNKIEENKSLKERIDNEKIYFDVISNYLKTDQFDKNIKLIDRSVINSVEFDPISNSSPIYDAYFQHFDQELFIYLIHSRLIYLHRDKLYTMLTKLYHYRESKCNPNIKLAVILIKSQKNKDEYNKTKNFLEKEFRPAISNGLLEIVEKEVDIEKYKN